MSGVSAAEIFWWVAVPYFALGVFVIGHIWRWRYDQFGWTSRSTQLQERRMLKWGSPIFHYATFAAIGGHILGILIPARFTEFLGIPDHIYHEFAAIGMDIVDRTEEPDQQVGEMHHRVENDAAALLGIVEPGRRRLPTEDRRARDDRAANTRAAGGARVRPPTAWRRPVRYRRPESG